MSVVGPYIGIQTPGASSAPVIVYVLEFSLVTCTALRSNRVPLTINVHAS